MAQFQLHVWGPAFGLDSIDVECLAAIKYCSQTFHYSGLADDWKIIPSGDPTICPSHQLPALLHNGVWTSGYQRIAKYLARHLNTPDTRTPSQRADALAYETYLTSRLTTLVDLSLYASATNWAAATRPAYSEILRFPLTWTVPTALRADAIRRVERFGFSDLDADGRADEDEEEDEVPAFRWKGLLKRRRVVDAMSAEQMVGIRLYSFARDILDVVQDGLGKEVVAEGDEGAGFSQTTWLLYACLAPMLEPDVPQAWLRTLLRSEFPRLVQAYERIRDSRGARTTATVATCQYSALSTARRFLHHVIESIPTLGHVYIQEWRRLLSSNKSSLDARSSALLSAAVFAAPTLTYGYRVWRGLPPFGSPAHVWFVDRTRNAKGLAKYGEIGAMLDLTVGAVDAGYGN
ncbi:uncharacterized protein DNG_05084 [Cephalotrichum gorgonifer]|uniref:Mitochondrial outer membrane transport complex Sam37/metaxin N-terminal domain-containing protein n=1 Tax=Cephalotrichum gorgonifer TaxID=2041049 RepID=A0AAE8MXA9_9PEZI|nr:uncharacterized protein DNG_05084 [Cephalotrichum gorgonifer]